MQFASVYNELCKALSVNGNQAFTITMIQAVSDMLIQWLHGVVLVACHLQHVHM